MSQETKDNALQLGPQKIKRLLYSSGNNHVKKKHTERERNFASYTSSRGLLFRVSKELKISKSLENKSPNLKK